ncbi:hypothetical protein OO014_05995 [Intrasporangium calvum]|uniref:EfeO-type cupredoxin-like domain-containing protein n=1 Tax=Intrasporangium calvum TaxID=53358 RepID=A0ABT5GEY8_9MICO|nr:hypothetical protein [Intrasporangium calvum]MDC5696803.1 hypothetical protein [Intrasporangium calvum]
MRVNRLLPYAACLLALGGATACGSPDAPPPDAVASAPVVKRMDIAVNGTTITPTPSQVDLGVGQAIELTVTVDHDDELHAHGFNGAEAELKAGQPTTVKLVGTESGVFEVETHDPALTILTVAVR